MTTVTDSQQLVMPGTASLKDNDLRIPLVIGVTGHRKIHPEAVSAVRARVRAVFAELRARYPQTPFLVLSPLAEGADQLVAQVALDAFRDGDRLIVPLPMPLADYAEDFEEADSLQEYRRLAEGATQFVLPVVEGNVGDAASREWRDRQYAAVGAFIARHSQILLALWDGDAPTSQCGTASIVEYKLHGIPAPYGPPVEMLDPVEGGPVYHVLTPRASCPSLPTLPGSLRVIPPDGMDSAPYQQRYEQILARIEHYNANLARHAARAEWTPAMAKNAGYVLPEQTRAALPTSVLSLLNYYAAADTLAITNQLRRKSIMKWLFYAAVGAMFFFELFAHLPKKQLFLLYRPYLLLLYPLILFVAYKLATYAQQQRYEDHHLDYRALAEGLRVQLFWRLAGLSDGVAEQYLSKQRSELDWIRYTLRSLDLLTSPALRGETAMPARVDLVMTHWVRDQLRFYEKSHHLSHAAHRQREWWARRLFLFGLLVAVAVALSLLIVHELPDWIECALVVGMAMLPACAAALIGYAEKSAFSALAKQYQRMHGLFSLASRKLEGFMHNNDLVQAQRLIRELGIEALAENGDWVLLHRERPLELHY